MIASLNNVVQMTKIEPMEITKSQYLSRVGMSVAGIPVIILSGVVVVAMRCIALLSKLFGQMDAYHYLSYGAKKISLLYIHHTIDYLPDCPLPLLAYSKNLARPNVVRQEEDMKQAKVFREQYLSTYAPNESLEKLRLSRLTGANSSGVCFGATLSFIKSCLVANITSRAQLVSLCKQYEEGFDAQSCALQIIYNKTTPCRVAMVEKWQAEGTAEQQHEEDKCQYYDSIAALIGLKIDFSQQRRVVYNVEEDEFVQAFNQIENGLWKIDLLQHTLCYLKYDFGSYFFDPDEGLMSCGDISPSQVLKKLLKSNQRDPTFSLRLYKAIKI